MSIKYQLVLAFIALAATFAAGRYSVKSTVKTEIVRIDDTKKEQVATQIHTVVVQQPNGVVTTTTDTDSTTQIVDVSKTTDQLVQQTNTRKTLNVSLLGSYNFISPGTPDVGISVSREILGPVTAGIWGMRSGVIGLSIGINF